MITRDRSTTALPGRVCSMCSGTDLVLVESRRRRRPVDRLKRHWSDDVRRYELCNGCRARTVVHENGRDVDTDGLGIPVQQNAG